VALQGLDVGLYSLNVSVSDGKFHAFESARVAVYLVTDDLLEKAVVVQLAKVSPQEFLLSYRKSFVKAVKTLFNVRTKDIEIIGVQAAFGGENSRAARSVTDTEEDELDEEVEAVIPKKNRKKKYQSPEAAAAASEGEVATELLLAVRRDSTQHLSRAEVRQALAAKLAALAAQTGLQILGVAGDNCEQAAATCLNGRCRDLVLMSESEVVSVTTDVDALVFPRFRRRTVCECRVGFSGSQCETIANECHREPCPSYKVCVPDTSEVKNLFKYFLFLLEFVHWHFLYSRYLQPKFNRPTRYPSKRILSSPFSQINFFIENFIT
jgi:protocadherin Fat 1/2/3